MKKRTNFLPALLLTLLWLFCLIYLLLFTAPDSFRIIFIFYLFFFLFSFFFFSLLLSSSRRGLILSCGLISLAFLQQLKLINLLNVLIISALVVITEIFFAKS